MGAEIEGLDDFIGEIEGVEERSRKVQEAIAPVINAKQPDPAAWQKIRDALNLEPTLRPQMPLIEDMSEEEILAMIEKKGLESVVEGEFLLDDLRKYVFGG